MYRIFSSTADEAFASNPLTNQVAMAYLDPPYNTGRVFHQYNDRTPVNDWLRLMTRTLAGVHGSLKDNGVAFVHLDDKYIHRIRCIMDDIFGDDNYVGTIIWEKKNRPSFLHAQLAGVTDHILVYAKNRPEMKPLIHASTEIGKRIPIHHKGNANTTLSFPAGSMAFNFADTIITPGPMNTPTITSALLDELVVEDGVNKNPFRISGPFRYSQDTITKMAASSTEPAFLCPRPLLRPSYLSQATAGKVLTNLQSFRINGAPTNEDANAESVALFGSHPFDTPKPEGLIERLIAAATEPGDLVLDPFAGSGTTLSVALKLGRDSIGFEKNKETVEKYILPRLEGVITGTDPFSRGNYAPHASVLAA